MSTATVDVNGSLAEVPPVIAAAAPPRAGLGALGGPGVPHHDPSTLDSEDL